MIPGDDTGGPDSIWLTDEPLDGKSFARFIETSHERAKGLPLDWFQVPYRTKREALKAVFGGSRDDEGSLWNIAYVPVDADIRLHCYLLTRQHTGQRVLVVFQSDHSYWYDPANREAGLVRGFTRRRRTMLGRVVDSATYGASLAEVLWAYGLRSTGTPPNPQAAAYVLALFEVWLAEQQITGHEADALRLFVGLGGYIKAVDMMTKQPSPAGH